MFVHTVWPLTWPCSRESAHASHCQRPDPLTGCRRARLAGARGLGLGSIVFLFTSAFQRTTTGHQLMDCEQPHGL